jgi:hypothetical protein
MADGQRSFAPNSEGMKARQRSEPSAIRYPLHLFIDALHLRCTRCTTRFAYSF